MRGRGTRRVLRQLARLTRPVLAAPGAIAIAVYADALDRPVAANERGHEGVACIDDAARAILPLCDLWAATREPFVRAWAGGLVEFLLYMQERDGRFVNFISDWSGTKNGRGMTSFAGGSFWQARGVRGLARAWLALDDPRAGRGVITGLRHVREAASPADVRAIHVLTAIDLLRAGRLPELRADLAIWADELVACRRDGVLYDNPDESEPHLWGHVQEAALAEAGAFLDRPDLVDIARESCALYLEPLIASGFDLASVQPYGVACAVAATTALAARTGDARFVRLAQDARAWFHERNRAGRAVYDLTTGRVHDGIDDGVLNAHSGAESNIAAAEALSAELPRIAAVHLRSLERILPLVPSTAAARGRAMWSE